MTPQELTQRLDRDGWAELKQIEVEDLIKLTTALGGAGTVRHLETREREEASRRSLSSLHGRGEFPPHTDGAAMARPPRFVAMRSDEHYEAATLLLDGAEEELALPLYSQSWLVDGGARPFYAVPRRRIGGEVHWRLNPDIMRPLANAGQLGVALSQFVSISRVRIEWEPGLAVVWDNRRMLHSREAVAAGDGCRRLMRVSVA